MQKKKGISLIVLVITIIVMIILAAAIILSLNNAGIIGNANKAVDDTNIANIKAAADLAYAEYLIAPVELTVGEDLGEYLTKKLVENNTITGDDYVIGICDNETVVAKAGTAAYFYYKDIIKIGDYINYDPTKGVEDTSNITYRGKWQVMGINKRNQLLLLSENYIAQDEDFIVETDLSRYTYMNAVAGYYGHGKGATEARSITVDDVNRITRYNPEKAVFGKGRSDEYGAVVTYYWDGTDTPYYEISNDLFGNMGKHTTFYWFDVNNKYSSTKPSADGERQQIVKIKNSDYAYYAETLTYNASDDKIGLTKDSVEYKMLFNKNYWLATPTSSLWNGKVFFGFLVVSGNGVYGETTGYSDGKENVIDAQYGYRAVVSLDSEVEIGEQIDSIWEIVVK